MYWPFHNNFSICVIGRGASSPPTWPIDFLLYLKHLYSVKQSTIKIYRLGDWVYPYFFWFRLGGSRDSRSKGEGGKTGRICWLIDGDSERQRRRFSNKILKRKEGEQLADWKQRRTTCFASSIGWSRTLNRLAGCSGMQVAIFYEWEVPLETQQQEDKVEKVRCRSTEENPISLHYSGFFVSSGYLLSWRQRNAVNANEWVLATLMSFYFEKIYPNAWHAPLSLCVRREVCNRES